MRLTLVVVAASLLAALACDQPVVFLAQTQAHLLVSLQKLLNQRRLLQSTALQTGDRLQRCAEETFVLHPSLALLYLGALLLLVQAQNLEVRWA